MKTQKILLGGLAGGIAFFLLGWLIYGVLLMNYTTANYNQTAARPMEEMIWWSLILSNFGFGFILAFVFSWSDVKGLLSGAITGGILGFLIAVSMDLSMYSMNTMFMGFAPVIVDVIATTVLAAISGIVVSWVMNMGKKTA